MDDINVRIEAPEFVDARTPVPYSVVITNNGNTSTDLHLQGREIVFDLSVIGDGGAVVWRRMEGQVAQAILRLDTLAPEESLTLSDVWDQRDLSGTFVEPGFYTLQAGVPTGGEPLLSRDRLLHVIGD